MYFIAHSMTVMTSGGPATLEMCKKANIVLSTFSACDPLAKTVLFSSHCLSLYGGALWDITCIQLKSLEVAFNNILRRIWRLPRNCHTRILHKVAHLDSIFNRLTRLSDRFYRNICKSKSYLLRNSFTTFYTRAFTPIGSNHYSAHKYQKKYFEEDIVCAEYVRYLRTNKDAIRDLDTESIIKTICCD